MGRPTAIGRVVTSAAITGGGGITDTLSGAGLVAAMDLHTMAATLAMREDKMKLRSMISPTLFGITKGRPAVLGEGRATFNSERPADIRVRMDRNVVQGEIQGIDDHGPGRLSCKPSDFLREFGPKPNPDTVHLHGIIGVIGHIQVIVVDLAGSEKREHDLGVTPILKEPGYRDSARGDNDVARALVIGECKLHAILPLGRQNDRSSGYLSV